MQARQLIDNLANRISIAQMRREGIPDSTIRAYAAFIQAYREDADAVGYYTNEELEAHELSCVTCPEFVDGKCKPIRTHSGCSSCGKPYLIRNKGVVCPLGKW